LAIPEKDKVMIKSLGSSLRLLTKQIDKVELLGAGALQWSQTMRGLKVKLPAEKPCEHALVIKITPK
jgi:alpha-L-fucosidase